MFFFFFDMIIACALRYGVAYVGVYSTDITHPVVGPPFRYRECAGRRHSLEAAIVKKVGVVALVLTFVKYIRTNCFDICFCVKSIVIKLLRTMAL